MRFIYLDEAGISASECVTVVAGVIVNADQQLALAETRIQELLIEYAPGGPRAGFAFHATDIFSGRNLFQRPQYPLERAIKILTELVSLPLEFGLPIAISVLRKPPLEESNPATRRAHEEMFHGVTFSLCVMKVEQYLREKTEASEVGKLVAENNTTTRQRLKEMQEMLRGEFRTSFRRNIFDLYAGATQNSLPLTKIRTSVFFSEKTEEPMLQIADAVAFFVKRYYEGKSDVDQFIAALIGNAPFLPEFEDGVGGISTIISQEYQRLP